jgi:hypothetical protein
MDVAAEGNASISCNDASRGIRLLPYVAPFHRLACFGMDIEPIILLKSERQLGDESPLCQVQSSPGPLDHSLCLRVHGFGLHADSIVMIAADGQCAGINQVHNYIDRPLGIGAISNVVTEADDLFCTARASDV